MLIKGLSEQLKKHFNIVIKNQELFDEAFTQASYVNEHPEENLKFYERLEFLGDAVMQLVVSEYIYRRYPRLPQGQLTRLRAAMVNTESFAIVARECYFDRYIRLGKGEEKAGARERDSLLCDIFESFIGALYLDQGVASIVKFANQVIFSKLDESLFNDFFDHKTELQELVQQNGPVTIEYKIVSEDGTDNDRVFKAIVIVDGIQLGIGKGSSKKHAEQMAAQMALTTFTRSN